MVALKVKFFQKTSVFHPEADLSLAFERSGHSSERPSLWDLPGRNVRYGELHEVAIVREILEGTALSDPGLRMIQAVKAFFQSADVDPRPVSYRATDDATRLTDRHKACGWLERGLPALPSALYPRATP